MHQLLTVEPSIYDEKVFAETGVRDSSAHNTLKRRVLESRSRATTLDDLHALLDVLYVVRCNLFKGDKVRDASRDEEVLAAATPPLLALVSALLVVREQAVERSA